MNARDEAQKSIVDLYEELDLLKSCGVLSTGFGKSKVTIDIIKRLNPEKVLILVNSTLLRDYNWEQEFITWGEEELFKKVELATYQSAYKWKKDKKLLTGYFVIADEVDFAADTEELSKFFYEYPEVKVLGLTGYITPLKKPWFDTHLPVFSELTAAQAQEMKILNKTHIVFVKYDLSIDKKDIVVSYKKDGEIKHFTQSENNAYDYANKKVFSIIGEVQAFNKKFMLGDITRVELEKAIKSLEYKLRIATKEREDILLHSKSNREMTTRLVKYILEQSPDNKVIVFSKRTEQSLKLFGEDNVYNGAVPKKKAEENYKNFNSGSIRVLGVCEKVNRGANIEGLNNGILESFYGSDTQATQRFGRLMRLSPNQTATMYVLLPYYMRKEINNTYTLQETQQVKWARNMLSGIKIKSSTVWDYCVVKSNPND